MTLGFGDGSRAEAFVKKRNSKGRNVLDFAQNCRRNEDERTSRSLLYSADLEKPAFVCYTYSVRDAASVRLTFKQNLVSETAGIVRSPWSSLLRTKYATSRRSRPSPWATTAQWLTASCWISYSRTFQALPNNLELWTYLQQDQEDFRFISSFVHEFSWLCIKRIQLECIGSHLGGRKENRPRKALS